MKANSYKPGSERTLEGVTCPKCGSDHLRRVKREGFWQVSFLPKFGYFPWECAHCRITVMLRHRGERKRRQPVEARDSA